MNTQIALGIVENRNDPLKLGRYQVRIFGVHTESVVDIPTDSLPWALTLNSYASLSGIGQSANYLEGSMVFVFFQDGDSKQMPIILGSAPGIPTNKITFPGGTVLEETIQYSPAESAITPATSTIEVSTAEQSIPIEQNTTPEPAIISKLSDVYAKIKTALGFRESSNNYQAVNSIGYMGKYQFGAVALIDLKYLYPKTSQQMLKKLTKLRQYETLPSNPTPEQSAKHRETVDLMAQYFTGKTGIIGVTSFLNSAGVQEDIMDKFLVINTKTLKKISVITEESTAQEIGGYLCSSHLIGCGGTKQMKQGIIKKDGNGITGNEYYNLGYNAVAGTSVPTNKESVIPPAKITPPEAKIENPNREQSNVGGIGITTDKQATFLPGIGFSDPTGTYPRYVKEQDTNRLMRNQNIGKTVVPVKEANAIKSVRVAGGSTWDQPSTPYNTIYPYNQVMETESGHILEFDDTPNNERIHLYHKTGTFTEIDCNGTKVEKIIGDSYQIIDRNGFISITGDCNVTIDGNANIVVKNNVNLEVNGNLNAAITGNANWNVEGSWNVSAYAGVSYTTHGGFSATAFSDMSLRSGGVISAVADSNISATAGGDVNVNSSGNTTINSGGNIDVKAVGNGKFGVGGSLDLKGSTVAIDGATVHINSGRSNAVPGSKPFTVSMATWSPPNLPDALAPAKLEPLTLPPRHFEMIAEFDDETDITLEQASTNYKILQEAGLIADNPLDSTVEKDPVEIEPTNKEPVVISDCGMFKPGAININDYISKNFTLKMLTKGKAIPGSQSGYTDTQLACNLKTLAENVLEPIKLKYPDMIITSGLRPMGSNARSQHPKGMAADLQFPTHKSSDYINIAKYIIETLNTDQTILEYRTNSANSRPGNPVTWIHVSFNRDGNRKMYFTMNNDIRVGNIGELRVISC